ncbi:hypothetical protein QYE76_011851 [Lolium multiflorum]|uniref:Uncharacterized protein n=1 Tax=Lolium multiflorum TaxID=4521 RepID=A0AAD8TZY9_LOLMU|nr:hypothetical protein QYE76_008338 [Lolium multiflorum]KAK1695154.1 hypothetical protein QYE76_011851 [Lolium multiflorum]
MEDEAPPASVKLEALVPEDYDEDAATAAAMEMSKAEEDVVQLSTMVVEHVASLPPPPPLALHAPPQATWEGQMVPPPPQYASPATRSQYVYPPQYVPHPLQ